MENKTRSITEGAMMIALIAVFLLINRQFANVLEMLTIFLSIPIAVYTHRYGLSMGLVVCFCSVFLGFIFSGFTTTFYLITAVLCGAINGFGTRNKWPNKFVFFALIIINVISTYLEVIVLSSVFGYDINEEVAYTLEMINSYMTDTMDFTQYVLTIVILGYIAVAILQAFAIHLVTHVVMIRLKLDVLPIQNISLFTFPRWCAFFVILSFAGYMYSSYHPLNTLANNTLLAFYCIGNIIAIIQGCVALLCVRRRRSFFYFFIVLTACMIPVINTFIAFYGLADMIFQKRVMMNSGGQQ